MFLAESLFQLKFCAKQLDRLSKKAEKEQRANEKKVIFNLGKSIFLLKCHFVTPKRHEKKSWNSAVSALQFSSISHAAFGLRISQILEQNIILI